ncbi:hypothetical protein BC835DRAFT_1384848 [Cytidiella melzeri]|nr:hypothetical protein BC835DRAFT_1384848 [Cytidiella melzeri]
MATSTSLLDIPPEILEQILLELDPLDVGAISQTCALFAQLIYGSSSELFWRKLYLSVAIDDPRQCVDPIGNPIKSVEWKKTLQRIIRARTVVMNPELCREEERVTIWQTLLQMASNTFPLYHTDDYNLSLNFAWLAALLRGGKFLEHSLWELSPEERQLRAHFHTLYGLTPNDFSPERRVETRCSVYALRNYSLANIYGPFLPDNSGTVDWERVLAIQHVISMHIVLERERSPEEFTSIFIGSPMSLPYCGSVFTRDLKLEEVEDWAGVEGTWQCSFCFCDHRDLLVFNNYASINGPLRREVFEDPEFTEAFTMYEFKIHVTHTEYDEAHPTRPIIHFKATSQGSNHAEMEGWVGLSSKNDIHWHFVSNHMWSSEGIQVGGVRSTFGVLGIWSTVQHERSDPVGPYWLRKVLDG